MLTRLATLLLFTGCSLALGQSTTQEDMGVLPTSTLSHGLGWQVDSRHEVEFAAAAAAGATHVRLDACTWSSVEKQSAPPANVSAGYSLPQPCANGLLYAKKYGLTPTVIAAYGAPYHQVLTLTLVSGASAGSTSLAVEYASGVGGDQLDAISYPNDYLIGADGGQITKKYSYDGSLITGIQRTGSSTATLTLSSALTSDLAAGKSLAVNEILYPSVISASPTESSSVAYGRYARYLATQIQAYGLTGSVELWNEPPWTEDCWDNRRDCYDTDPMIPNELTNNLANYGFPAVLQTTVPVPGVNYVWAGTNKSGSADLLSGNMLKYTGVTFIEPQTTVTEESLHPYGSNPEDKMWNQGCLVASPAAGQKCNTVLTSGSNFVSAESKDLVVQQQSPSFGIGHVITETGASSLYMPADHIARFVVRQYLGFMADDIPYVDFYKMYDTSVPGQLNFSFVTLNDNNTTYTPLPQYTALAGFLDDVATMNLSAVASYTASSLPTVASYSGTYNLDHLTLVGARYGDKANSIMYVLFQRSFSPTACNAVIPVPCWATLEQPAEAQTIVSLPSGLKVAQVVNLVTRATVAYSQSGSSITVGVSDDPIELMLVPNADSTSDLKTPKLVFDQIEDQQQGNTLLVGAFSDSPGAISYSVVSGPASIAGNVVHVNSAGTVVLQASQAASGNYSAASTTSSFVVTAKDPGLKFVQITPKKFGDVVGALAQSLSPGRIAYSVLSGPAVVSGTQVTMTGAGTVVLGATQAASGFWAPDTATISFPVSGKAPSLSFVSISSIPYGTPYTLKANTNSSGPITYSVVSGPATISGSVVTPTSEGEVEVLASLAADGRYLAATAVMSFHVNAITPQLVLTSIPEQAYNYSFAVTATSPSNGSIIYSIGSGPARVSGSTITTLSTAGTVVVKAYQVNSGGYNSATATTSFTVAATVANTSPTLVFQAIPTTTLGNSLTVTASSASSGAITYSVQSGPATISGNLVTPTGAGTVVLKATQSASGKYDSATATTSFVVKAQTPNLAFVSLGTVAFNQVFPVSATSSSNGTITYTVVSGPATIAGSTVTSLSTTGTVVLQASQAASGNYGSATATTSFKVAGADPSLTFAKITPKTFADTFSIRASSVSNGPIQYSVVSGPAVLSGSQVTMIGAGTVVLQAEQAASGGYGQAVTTISIPVVPDKLPLTFAPITPKTFADVFGVKATANSPGAISYSVVSGPATITGSTVTMIGAGTVTLKASQAASGVYPAATTTISFPVSPDKLLLTFTPITPKTFADVLDVRANASSPGAITYSVVSGPATITGSTVTMIGAGTVTLGASQVASGVYPAATTTISFPVVPDKWPLAFVSIASQTVGDVVVVRATASSKGAITYSVVSGPASVTGNSVTTTGTGTVTLKATQVAFGVYPAATTTTSFTVAPKQ